MYRAEHVVAGPANHAHARIVFDKEHSTAIVLSVSSPMPQRGSRKGETFGAGFSEPPNKELDVQWTNDEQTKHFHKL